MRHFLLVIFLVNYFISFGQETANVTCSRTKDLNGQQNISYYQYPSLNKYDVKYLKIDLSVETNSRFLSGTSTTIAKALAPLDSFIMEIKNTMVIDSVYINGVKKVFSQGNDHVFIPLVPAVVQGGMVNAQFFYKGTASGSGVFTGTVGSNGLNYTATLSESYQAREWFPVKQILRDKIDSADMWFTTSATNKVGSNGLLQSVMSLPGGKVQYRWKEKYPMNYYMPSFSVGNYMEYLNYAKPAAMAPDSILIQHYIVNNPTYFAGIKPNLDKTPVFIEKMSELFGLYPFKNEKYGHAHAAIGGGMEHQTMSTMAGFTSTLIAHELGHQWWGDNVTCATWNDIWLNEGFASYCEYLMIEKLPALIPSTTASAFMQGYHNSVMSSPGGSVFIPQASVFDENRIFDSRLSYAKGATVIHNLRFEMQDDNLFFNALKTYQTQYKDSVASTGDLKRIAETVSGKDLTDFFNQLIYGEGFPTFNVTFFKEGQGVLVLRISETTSMPSITPFFKGLYEFTITSAQGDTTVKVNLAANNQEFRFNYNKTPGGIVVDPNNWVVNATGTIVNGGVVIPASQVTLSGIANDCKVNLSWTTLNEHNISKYEVEYGVSPAVFSKVGEVAGTNTYTDQQHGFIYQPSAAAAHHYFRLKILDTLSQLRYSNVIDISLPCNYIPGISVGPVPYVSGPLTLYVTSASMGVANIYLYNALGEMVYTSTEPVLPGLNRLSVPLYRFPKGIYILRAISGTSKISTKISRL